MLVLFTADIMQPINDLLVSHTEEEVSGDPLLMENLYSDTLGDAVQEGNKKLNEAMALLAFFRYVYTDHPALPTVLTYQGLIEDTEVKYIRYQTEDRSYTFVVEDAQYPTFLASSLSLTDAHVWSDSVNRCADMARRGYKRNVTKLPIEFPLKTFLGDRALGDPQDPHPLDDLLNGDLILLSETIDRFVKELHERVGVVTSLAMRIGKLVPCKDHDLYLTFKGVDQLTKINVGLDRVYPLLPESGERELGDTPISLDDWKGYSKEIQVLVKRISHAGKQINRMISGYRGRLPAHPHIQKTFADELKIQLMAATHFMKEIYGFSRSDGRPLIEEVANDIIRKLTAHGGNIGLDLNSWIVYDYDVEGRPKEIREGDLNFLDTLYNRYTVSFVDALYAFLIGTPNPYIRPYNYRQVVSGDDGVAIGSIRQVK